MEIKKILTGEQAGLTITDLAKKMNNWVYQYKSAAKQLYAKGYYIRKRSFHPREGLPMAADIYILTDDGVKTLCYNTRPARASTAFKAYQNGTAASIDPEIWENYITNGYNTRAGLFRAKPDINRLNQIARSHADYLGNETGNSSLDHKNRLKLRVSFRASAGL